MSLTGTGVGSGVGSGVGVGVGATVGTGAGAGDAVLCVPPNQQRVGFLKGQIKIPDDFDRMCEEEIIMMFEGQEPFLQDSGEEYRKS